MKDSGSKRANQLQRRSSKCTLRLSFLELSNNVFEVSDPGSASGMDGRLRRAQLLHVSGHIFAPFAIQEPRLGHMLDEVIFYMFAEL